MQGSQGVLGRCPATSDVQVAVAANYLADILSNNVARGVDLPDPLICGDVTLSSQQRKAIATAFSSRLSMILGGAGSGKTTLIRTIDVLVEYFSIR